MGNPRSVEHEFRLNARKFQFRILEMFMVLLSILGIISEAMQHFKSWNGSCNSFGYYGNDIKGDLWVIVVSLLK